MPEINQNQENAVGSDLPPDATTYGGVLRIAREGKDLTVDQVASQLRISPGQIEGLESDNYKVFPTPVYARAHLRSYARLLGLDEAKVIDLFNDALSPEDKDPRTFIKKTTSDLGPYQDAQPKNFVGKFVAGLLFLAVLIVVGYFGYNYVSAPENGLPFLDKPSVQQSAQEPFATQEQPAASKEVSPKTEHVASEKEPEKTVKVEPATPVAGTQTDKAKEDADAEKARREQELKERLQQEAEEKAKQKQEEEKQAALAKEAEQKSLAAVAETSRPGVLVHNPEGHWELPIGAAISDPVKVSLRGVKGECWYGIYRDNKLIFNVQLKAGQSRDYNVEMPFKVSVGNRLNGAVEINGQAVELDNKTNSTSTVFTVLPR